MPGFMEYLANSVALEEITLIREIQYESNDLLILVNLIRLLY